MIIIRVKLFDAIRLISVYLEKRLGVDTVSLFDSKLSYLLKPLLIIKTKM